MKEIDRIDRKILRAIQDNGRLTNLELADTISLSPTATAERLKRLNRDGYIQGYTAKLSPEKLHRGMLVFVEVKKSRSFDHAMQHLSSRQIARLLRAGEEFAGTQPRGSLTEMRFDVALMNEQGMIRIVENALGP